MLNSSVTNFGTAGVGGYGLCHAAETIIHVAVAGAATQDVSRSFPNVWQVCDDGDIVGALLPEHAEWLGGPAGRGDITHTSYCVTGKRGTRCEQSITTAGQALGRGLSTHPMPDVTPTP